MLHPVVKNTLSDMWYYLNEIDNITGACSMKPFVIDAYRLRLLLKYIDELKEIAWKYEDLMK